MLTSTIYSYISYIFFHRNSPFSYLGLIDNDYHLYLYCTISPFQGKQLNIYYLKNSYY
ncbi:hypothetical protein GCM10008905_09440 [Clostridium malenominatum]|uniref:Uncharacterized protein n=1 Tax=Clostridium malenominatum TaxID=1539 RepID=A0ABN1ISI5_9CLOT